MAADLVELGSKSAPEGELTPGDASHAAGAIVHGIGEKNRALGTQVTSRAPSELGLPRLQRRRLSE